jgi:hypothetical protein
MKRYYISALFSIFPILLLEACSASSGAGNGGGLLPLSTESVTTTASISGKPVVASAKIGTGALVTLPSLQAVGAKAFIDSIGVNTHFNYPAYHTSFAKVESLLAASGIRHIRDGFVTNPSSAYIYYGYLQQVAASGIHGTMLTTMNMPIATILANVQAVPNFTEAIEPPNEYDLSGDLNWAANLAAYQQTLYTGVKSTSGLSLFPVLGPALTMPASYAAAGNLSASMDQGNMHDYFAGYNPGTTGYGGGGFGSVYGTIAYNLGEAAQTDGTKPVVATETGYCTMANIRNTVTPAIQGKYLPRMFLEQWLAGVVRTIDYELIDEGNNSVCSGNYGLLSSSLAPKPGYYAVQSLIQTLADSGTQSSPAALPLALTPSATTIHHLLFQKANGTYILALWNEVQSWNVNAGTGTAVTPTPVSITMQLAATPASSSINSINDAGALQAGALNWSNGNATITLDDHVTLVTYSM